MHTTQGADTICFFKLDKFGNNAWGGKRKVNFKGIPPELMQTNKGTFAFVHKHQILGDNYSVITELDKDLNRITQNAVKNLGSFDVLDIRDISFTSDSTILYAGIYTDMGNPPLAHVATSKTDKNQRLVCDTSVSIFQYFNQQVGQTALSTVVSSRTFVSTNVTVQNMLQQDSSIFLCNNFNPLSISLGSDTSICSGTSIVLKNISEADFDSFLWSTGDTSKQINVNQSGTYILVAYNSCRQEERSDTIEVKMNQFPDLKWINDTSICSVQPIVLTAFTPSATYKWNDGSEASTMAISDPGNYYVDISYLNCIKRFDVNVSDCELIVMPNVISVDGNDINEDMKPIEYRGVVQSKLSIFNRWGQEIYFTTEPVIRPWKGNAYSKNSPPGVYFWLLEYTNYRQVNKVLKGSITLFRD